MGIFDHLHPLVRNLPHTLLKNLNIPNEFFDGTVGRNNENLQPPNIKGTFYTNRESIVNYTTDLMKLYNLKRACCMYNPQDKSNVLKVKIRMYDKNSPFEVRDDIIEINGANEICKASVLDYNLTLGTNINTSSLVYKKSQRNTTQQECQLCDSLMSTYCSLLKFLSPISSSYNSKDNVYNKSVNKYIQLNNDDPLTKEDIPTVKTYETDECGCFNNVEYYITKNLRGELPNITSITLNDTLNVYADSCDGVFAYANHAMFTEPKRSLTVCYQAINLQNITSEGTQSINIRNNNFSNSCGNQINQTQDETLAYFSKVKENEGIVITYLTRARAAEFTDNLSEVMLSKLQIENNIQNTNAQIDLIKQKMQSIKLPSLDRMAKENLSQSENILNEMKNHLETVITIENKIKEKISIEEQRKASMVAKEISKQETERKETQVREPQVREPQVREPQVREAQVREAPEKSNTIMYIIIALLLLILGIGGFIFLSKQNITKQGGDYANYIINS